MNSSIHSVSMLLINAGETSVMLKESILFYPCNEFFFKIPPSFFQAGNHKQKFLSSLRVSWLHEALITLPRLESRKIV